MNRVARRTQTAESPHASTRRVCPYKGYVMRARARVCVCVYVDEGRIGLFSALRLNAEFCETALSR